jgi:hypothetical protein
MLYGKIMDSFFRDLYESPKYAPWADWVLWKVKHGDKQSDDYYLKDDCEEDVTS